MTYKILQVSDLQGLDEMTLNEHPHYRTVFYRLASGLGRRLRQIQQTQRSGLKPPRQFLEMAYARWSSDFGESIPEIGFQA